jgi:hypothetical protein
MGEASARLVYVAGPVCTCPAGSEPCAAAESEASALAHPTHDAAERWRRYAATCPLVLACPACRVREGLALSWRPTEPAVVEAACRCGHTWVSGVDAAAFIAAADDVDCD